MTSNESPAHRTDHLPAGLDRPEATSTGSMETGEMTAINKSIVQRAMTGLLETGDVEALARMLSDDFRHHRSDVTTTKTEWSAAVRAALVPLAGMQVEIHRILADGDYVVVHSHRRLPDGFAGEASGSAPESGPAIEVVEIWRLRDGLIAEGWEIIEPSARAAADTRWWQVRADGC
ncbi:nuclear transport factor 2 family protein [Actinoplanes sp. N902-109]|uniref:nuclear transport factor 2 family protein n=1 Tax=Actinoplanes sp. (strain N902-109) TaxID=649831 RepID=UPI0003295582|nr:nuclear transport factor 2 family protein [Actinoplanes sp. N902-109]AGL17769.1 hypothetical protein L083_4259 [Actinoplanes sp. N902-109]